MKWPNGCKKIVVVNGHGGNESFLPYFAQSQLDSPKDYIVYIYGLHHQAPDAPPLKDKVDEHAGETETSLMMISRPDLVHMNRVGQESGADQDQPICPPACIPAYGGMRSSPITMPATRNTPMPSLVKWI